VFLKPLRDKTVEHVAQTLISIYLSHGFYAAIKSDLGSEFINSIQAELDALTDVTRFTTTAYSPRNNPVERMHQSLHAAIAKLVDNHTKWSEYLDSIAFAFNSTVSKSTGFTPNYLQFGRELGNSVSLLLPKPPAESESYGQFASDVHERMTVAYDLAREELNASAELAKRIYDKKVRPKQFLVNDSVLVYSPRRYSNKFSKWQRLYSAECKIVSKLSDVSYIVHDIRAKRNRVTHVDKIKLLSRPTAVQTTEVSEEGGMRLH
jgi:hypothetical protein